MNRTIRHKVLLKFAPKNKNTDNVRLQTLIAYGSIIIRIIFISGYQKGHKSPLIIFIHQHKLATIKRQKENYKNEKRYKKCKKKMILKI